MHGDIQSVQTPEGNTVKADVDVDGMYNHLTNWKLLTRDANGALTITPGLKSISKYEADELTGYSDGLYSILAEGISDETHRAYITTLNTLLTEILKLPTNGRFQDIDDSENISSDNNSNEEVTHDEPDQNSEAEQENEATASPQDFCSYYQHSETYKKALVFENANEIYILRVLEALQAIGMTNCELGNITAADDTKLRAVVFSGNLPEKNDDGQWGKYSDVYNYILKPYVSHNENFISGVQGNVAFMFKADETQPEPINKNINKNDETIIIHFVKTLQNLVAQDPIKFKSYINDIAEGIHVKKVIGLLLHPDKFANTPEMFKKEFCAGVDPAQYQEYMQNAFKILNYAHTTDDFSRIVKTVIQSKSSLSNNEAGVEKKPTNSATDSTIATAPSATATDTPPSTPETDPPASAKATTTMADIVAAIPASLSPRLPTSGAQLHRTNSMSPLYATMQNNAAEQPAVAATVEEPLVIVTMTQTIESTLTPQPDSAQGEQHDTKIENNIEKPAPAMTEPPTVDEYIKAIKDKLELGGKLKCTQTATDTLTAKNLATGDDVLKVSVKIDGNTTQFTGELLPVKGDGLAEDNKNTGMQALIRSFVYAMEKTISKALEHHYDEEDNFNAPHNEIDAIADQFKLPIGVLDAEQSALFFEHYADILMPENLEDYQAYIPLELTAKQAQALVATCNKLLANGDKDERKKGLFLQQHFAIPLQQLVTDKVTQVEMDNCPTYKATINSKIDPALYDHAGVQLR